MDRISDNRRPNRFSSIRFKIGTLLVATVLVLVAAEIFVRFRFGDEFRSGLSENFRRSISIGTLIDPSDNPERHYELKPGLFEEWFNVLVSTDAVEPVRVSSFYPRPEKPAVKIALIGDSSSFGYRVYYEASYPAMLRAQFERRLGVPVEVRNYSAPGYNAIQERATLEEVLASWTPDLVLLHYDHNDADPQSAAPPNWIPPEYGDNALRSALLKFVLRRMRVLRVRGSSLYVNDEGEVEKLFRSTRSGGPRYDAHLEELKRMGAMLRERSIPGVAVIFEHGMGREDPEVGKHYEVLHPPLLATFEEAGFQVLDLYHSYQALMHERDWEQLKPFWVSEVDGHPNALGHQFITTRLLEYLFGDPGLSRLLEETAANRKDKANEIRPGAVDAVLAYQAGLVALDDRQIPEAIAAFEEALEFNPEDAGLRMNLARTHVLQNNVDAAIEHLEAALRLKPDFVLAHMQISQLYAYAERLDDSFTHLARVSEIAHDPVYYISACEKLSGVMAHLAQIATERGATDDVAKYSSFSVQLREEAERIKSATSGEK